MRELDYEKMGMRIQQVRKAKGLSQDKLAKKCGISLNFMGHIERGTRKMSMDTFVNLCGELEMEADTLLWGNAQHLEAEMQDGWGFVEQEDMDTYLVYRRIMRSVATILKGDGVSKDD